MLSLKELTGTALSQWLHQESAGSWSGEQGKEGTFRVQLTAARPPLSLTARPQRWTLSCSFQLRGWPAAVPPHSGFVEGNVHSGKCGIQWENSPRLLYTCYPYFLHTSCPFHPSPFVSTAASGLKRFNHFYLLKPFSQSFCSETWHYPSGLQVILRADITLFSHLIKNRMSNVPDPSLHF